MAPVGLDSFSYHLHLEDPDHQRDAAWFLEKTLGLGLAGCSFHPSHLQGWEDELIHGIGAFCQLHNLYLELTSAALDYARLCRRLILASQVGCRMLRASTQDISISSPADQRRIQINFVVENLKRLGEVAECVGVVLALTNRSTLSTAELIDVLRRVDSPFVRASFCNADVLAVLEDPLDAARELAPFIAGITLKDWCHTLDGQTIRHDGGVLGQGQAKVGEVHRMLREMCPRAPITLEIPTLSPVTTAESLEVEESRVTQSVAYIRSLEEDSVPV